MSLAAGVRKVCFFVLFFGFFSPRALAASAVCQAGWEWATNSKKQNPCEIAGSLEAGCQGFVSYDLGPLTQDMYYIEPQKNDSSAQDCECNTVMYSLYMLCTACQNVTTETWSLWSQFCAQVYVTQYPGPIPMDTAIPHWAFMNYTANDQFDPAIAKSAGGQPEVLAPVPSTVSLSSTSTGSLLPPFSAIPTSRSTNKDNNNKSNVGAVVGSVIGSLVILAVAGTGVWIFLRRRAIAHIGKDADYSKYSPTSESGHLRSPSQMRLYDPSDPSTYPTDSDYEMPHTTSSNNGRYSGVPEL